MKENVRIVGDSKYFIHSTTFGMIPNIILDQVLTSPFSSSYISKKVKIHSFNKVQSHYRQDYLNPKLSNQQDEMVLLQNNK